MNNQKYKQAALQDLKNNWKRPVILSLLYSVFTLLICLLLDNSTALAGMLSSLLLISYYFALYDHHADLKQLDYEEGLTSVFKNNRFLPALLTWLMSEIFIFLWSLLLIIPGIYKSIQYSMRYLILKDQLDNNENIGATDAITKSKEMMSRHEGDYFKFVMSFTGWFLLTCLTLGIGIFWLRPYFNLAKIHFYEDLKKEQAHKIEPVHLTKAEKENEPKIIKAQPLDIQAKNKNNN